MNIHRFGGALHATAWVLLAMIMFTGCVKNEPKHNNLPVSTYLKRLHSERERTVEQAIEDIVAIGGEATPFLVEAWQKAEDDTEYRCRIAKAIHGIGPDASAAVPVLVEALDALDEQLIACTAEALAGIGSASAPAAEKLAMLLRVSDTSTQSFILQALGGIGDPAAEPALDRVKEAALRPRTRAEAIEALGNMGPKSITAMEEWIKSGDEEKQVIACEAMAYAGDDVVPALPTLAEAMQYKNDRIRVAAIRAVAQAGPEAIRITDKLISALRYKDKETRDAAVNALAAIGQEIGPQLSNHLTDRNANVREGVVRVISRYGNLRDEYREQLIARLGDYNGEVRVAAINALTQAGETIVPRMRQLLNSKDVFIQFGAARIIGDIGGPEARKAIPKLRELQQHEDSLVRKGAEEALRNLQ
ncbi:hypothetical protein GF324_01580 [bacterium]|nr:hypothetical protein [bacterium]